MEKSKKKGLVSGIVAAVFTVIAMLGFAFKWMTSNVSMGGKTSSSGIGISDWFDHVKLDASFNKGKYIMWQVGNVLMWFLLVVVLVAVVLAFVKMFVNKKIFNTIAKPCAILGIILAPVWFIIMVVGSFMTLTSAGGMTSSIFPYPGAFIFALGLFVASIAANRSRKKSNA